MERSEDGKILVEELEEEEPIEDKVNNTARRSKRATKERVFLEPITAIDLSREIFAGLHLELRTISSNLSVAKRVISGFEQDWDKADPTLDGNELQIRESR